MIKLNLCLVALALSAVLEVNSGVSVNLRKNLNHLRGKKIGSADDKCSVLSGLLPDPKSGCCGRHAEQEDDKTGGEENNVDYNAINIDNNENENNEINHDNANSESGQGIINDDKNRNNNCGGAKCKNIGGVIHNVINDVFDSIEDGISMWIPKFQNLKAQLLRKSRSRREVMSLHGKKLTRNEITDDYNSNSPSDVVGLIAEGKQVGLNQYPWLVHIKINLGDFFFFTSEAVCGASLISPRFVLTAAHCVNIAYRSYDDVSIYLAEYNVNTSPDCIGNFCIENVVMHPDKIIMHEAFEPNHLKNDIALIRLRGSAPYTEYIRPICLAPFNIDVPKNEGTPLLIAGWGDTGHGSSPIKQAAQVQMVSQGQCKNYYGDLIPGQICATGRTGQNACKGDSGGPLMMEKDGSFYLVGIVSGKSQFSSCESSLPVFYTNVFAYKDWLEQNMSI